MSHRFHTPALTWTMILLGLVLLFAPGQVSAHELEPQRSVVAEVDDNSMSLMVVYEEIPGPRSDLFMTRYDLNGDGKIEGQEALLASREMIARMLAGLQFEVEFDSPNGTSPEIRFKVGKKGEVSAAAFIRFELASLKALPLPATRRVHIRLLPGDDNIPTEVLAIAKPGIRLLHVFQPPNSTTKDGNVQLSAGDQWTAVFVADATTEAPSAPEPEQEPVPSPAP